MNAQTNNTRQAGSPALVKSWMEKGLNLSRRKFLKGAAIGAAVLPAATVAVMHPNSDVIYRGQRTEYCGPGKYLIWDNGWQKVFQVEPAPWLDCKTDGRFYKATPVNEDTHCRYYTDAGFSDFAIKKLSSSEIRNA